MRRALLLASLLAAAPAQAALFELHAGLRFGGTTGHGIGGARKDNDFFAHSRGAVYGFLVGLEVLAFDLWVEHNQFTDFSGLRGTWTEIMLGPHFGLPVDDKVYADLGVAAGVGLGTGQQIEPPLDNGEVSDKGIMLGLRLGLEYRPSRFLGIGVSVPVEWGYMFKNGVPANDVSNHYQTFHAMVLGTLTLHLGL